MNTFAAAAFFLLFFGCSSNAASVVDHGAVGDGTTLDNEAFMKAWKETCDNPKSSPLIIPENKSFLLQPIEFSGPCKSLVNIQLSGEILAIEDRNQWKLIDEDKWIVFKNINGLSMDGNGKINGRGQAWWPFSCKINPDTKVCQERAPTSLNLIGCNNIRVNHINSLDSPQVHMSVYQSYDVKLEFVNIQAPADSPNTDGIHIQNSHDVTVYNSNIGSGDDCVSIGDQTLNIIITDIHCGPGHGVSVGSLGKNGAKVNVSNINVTNINFFETTNGARIKTWQVGSGQAENIQFLNLNFTKVKNPIIIDQHYCDSKKPCGETGTGVKLNNVTFAQALGTSATEVAINLNCSEVFPCSNILLDRITLTSTDPGKQVSTSCNHAQGRIRNSVVPDSRCLNGSILRSVGVGAQDHIDISEL